NGENPLTAHAVARAMLEGTESGRPSVIPGAGTKAVQWAAGIIPGLLLRYMDAKIARTRKQMSHAPRRGDVGSNEIP
ncbi:MAG TPA: hypothetical protein VEO01_28380, partial [Pseudonocardiaceae bacterium]|nr:hypothetical protein [Pseudonocardiaceae bacterium]